MLTDFDPSGITGSLVTEIVAFSNGVEDVTGGYETRLLALMNPTAGTGNADAMTGTSNAEVIKAQGGDDVIAGGLGNDVLLGGTGNDIYVFNAGDGFDLIDDQPGVGDTNRVQFGAGITQDMLRVSYNGTFGIGGLSVRISASGDGLHFLGVSAEDPTEPHAIDTFHFADGTQLTFAQLFDREVLVQGTGRSDGEVFGTFADDRMLGLGGSEALSSGDGNDTLIGGTGNDILQGGAGSDIYVFNPGDGVDEIRDDPGEQGSIDVDRLQFGIGITASDLTLFTARDGHTVNRVAVGTSGDEILLPNFVDYLPALTVAEFADGVTLDLYHLHAANRRTDHQTIIGGDGAVVLIGGSGNDTILAGDDTTTLLGGAGHDTVIGGTRANLLMGGRGNDFLQGGAGHDTYLFNLGDGIDTIDDAVVLGEGNRIQFGAGIGQSDLTFTQDQAARMLTIQVGTSGTDQLLLTNFDPTGANGSMVVETLTFADGSTANLDTLLGVGGPVATNGDDTITTGSGDDTVDALGGNDMVNTGAGNDTIAGGMGNDQLIGGAGTDTYLFNPGDGVDTITDQAAPGEGNTLEFGTGVAPTDLSLGVGSLLLRVGATGDAIHLMNFDPGNVLGPRTIESFRFADGTVLSYDQLIARGFDLTGAVSSDTIIGTNVVDRIYGLAGDDTILAGVGEDLLNGGAGSDSYIYNLGDGLDTIDDTAAVGAGNRVQFGTGISQSGLTFTRNDVARTLTIAVGGNGADKLVLTNFDPTGANGSYVVETLAFVDGSSMNLVDLYPPNRAPTVATPLADQTVPEDAPFSLVMPANMFADQDAADVLTLSASLADGTALPSWLGFDAATRTFTGMPDDAQVGTLDLKVTATDSGNLSVSDVFTLTVTNVNDAPTVATPLADQQATEDVSFNVVVPVNIFADADHVHGDQLAYSAALSDGSALPSWLNFDSTTRTFSGTPLNGEVRILNIDVTATDGEALSATDSFALTVQNMNDVPIVAAPIADQTAAEDSAFTLILPGTTFADEDVIHGDVLTYSAVLANGSPLPAWLSFNPSTRTFSGTPGAGDAGSLQIAVTATDSGTLSATDQFALVISGPLPKTLVGTTGNDVLTGGRGDDTLSGLAGNDQLNGGQGHDRLDGGMGTDTMLGGTGNDTYLVDVAGDVVTERANEGTDTVQSSLTYTLGAHVENLTLTGTANLNGTGNALDNILTGNVGPTC